MKTGGRRLTLEIGFGVPMDQRDRVAEILFEAFRDKYYPIFGRRSVSILTRYLRGDRTVVASIDGRTVGVAGLKFDGMEFVDLSFRQMLKELGWGVIKVIFMDWIFYERLDEKELLVEDLAVAGDMRGKGIGTSLLGFVFEFARSGGYERIKLLVIDTNKGAKRLYERIGFRETRVWRVYYPWNRIFGFGGASEMVYRLPP